MTEDIQLERRVSDSEFNPTWGELFTPIKGAMEYTARAGLLLHENSESPHYTKYALRFVSGIFKLAFVHCAEGGVAVAVGYYLTH